MSKDIRPSGQNVTEVSMYEGKALIVDGFSKIYTDTLMGCQAFFLKTKLKNGQTFAIMTHFPPTSAHANVEEIQRLIKQHEHLIDFTIRPRTAQVVPSENPHLDEILFPKIVYAIDKGVEKNFPNGVDKSIITYNYDEDICNPHCFTVTFPANKGDKILYSVVRETGNEAVHGEFGVL